MTTVIAVPDGFLAGGSVGPETLARHARFWHSTDGLAWTAVADDATAFNDAEVLGIATFGQGFVAVGPTGEVTTGSVAWTSPDGEHWTRIDAPDLRPAGPPRWPRVRTGSWPWARRSMSGRPWPGHRPMEDMDPGAR